MDRKPLQHAIYKGVSGKWGAVQFNFQRPHYYGEKGSDVEGQKDFTGNRALDRTGKPNDGWRQREGAIFIEASSATGKNVYDWESKITFACSVTDMGKIALFLTNGGDPIDIMHDPGAKTDRQGQVQKHVKMYSKGHPLKQGCMMTVSIQEGKDNKKEHQIPLSADECLIIRQLFLVAGPKALGW